MRSPLLSFLLLAATTTLAQPPINGPMPGYSECFGTAIWMQCQGPCSARLEYRPEGGDGPYAIMPTKIGDPGKAYAMTFDITAVEPGRTYEYRVFVDERLLVTPEPLFFHTQGLWKWRSDPPDFTVATGSCAYINEPPYDRPDGPKGPYGGGYTIFNSIADQRPDLMLWLGDNAYLREPDWGTWNGILHRYTHTRSTPELQRLLRSTHHYAIWDDHDFGPNDADGSFINAALTREAFDLFWPNPQGHAPGTKGITTSFSYSDVDFFLLDDRTERISAKMRTSEPTILGDAQIEWLIQALRYSDATFKMVALGGQFLNDAALFENYATVPAERQRIIDRITAEGITGVVFLTGDRHFTELSEMRLTNGNMLYDLTVSPLTSGAYAPQEENHLSVPGTRVAERNFGLLRFTGPKGDRTLTITVHSTEGEVIWEQRIKAPKK
ncbi:MAG TPA: alkaline phosphatase D family protein [Flavobacteriales bacterium]